MLRPKRPLEENIYSCEGRPGETAWEWFVSTSLAGTYVLRAHSAHFSQADGSVRRLSPLTCRPCCQGDRRIQNKVLRSAPASSLSRCPVPTFLRSVSHAFFHKSAQLAFLSCRESATSTRKRQLELTNELERGSDKKQTEHCFTSLFRNDPKLFAQSDELEASNSLRNKARGAEDVTKTVPKKASEKAGAPFFVFYNSCF